MMRKQDSQQQQHGRRLRPLLLTLALLSLLCALSLPEAAAADDGGDQPKPAVVELNTDNFADTIERQTAPALVMFVVRDKCEGCKQLAPVLEKVAANLKGIATVGTVDCNTVPAVRTCRAYAAHTFPKILVFKPGTKVNPYTGGSMKDFDEFAGAATAKGLISALTDTLDTTHLTQLTTSAQHEALVPQPQQQEKQEKQPPASSSSSTGTLARVLVFTDKAASTVLAKGLSWAYARRLVFAEVRPGEGDGKAIAEHYGVAKYPTIVVVKADGSSTPYSGSLKAPELRAFLDSFASQEPVAGATDGSNQQQQPGSDPFGALMQQVVLHSLGSSNLTQIDSQDDMWLLAFHAGSEADGFCSNALVQLHKLLVEVQSVVSFGAFNTTGVDAGVLAPYKLDAAALSASPCSLQLVLLPYGEHKQSKKGSKGISRWSGGLDDAKALQDWILQAVPDFTSSVSDEAEAERFLDATAADLPRQPPNGAHRQSAEERNAPIGKVLLFTTKSEAPAIYKALAMQFAGKSRLLFAWCQASASEGPSRMLMERMNVRKAPAMTILFPLPPKPLGTDSDEVPNNNPRDNMALQQYMGPLKFQKMLAWLNAMSTLTGMSYKSHAGATPGPSPEDFEVRSQQHLDSSCYDKPGLCLLTLLDGRSDSANKIRDTVKKSAAAHSGQPVNWVVLDVSQQPSFRRAYGFTADQLPALVALSTKRMRFAQGAAPYGEETTKQLVTKVLVGTAITLPLPDLPRLVPGGEAEEVEAEAVEEEFRLDEIMAEEVKELYRKEDRLKQADEELQREQEQQAAKKQKASTKKKSKSKKKKGGSKKQTKADKSASARDEL